MATLATNLIPIYAQLRQMFGKNFMNLEDGDFVD